MDIDSELEKKLRDVSKIKKTRKKRNPRRKYKRNSIPEQSSKPIYLKKGGLSNKEKHKIELRSPEWKALSARIKKRDNHLCQSCGKGVKDGKKLEVHHLLYERGKTIYDVPEYYLVTLCAECHHKEHSKQFIPPSKHFK